jgi:hypothetical protein
MPQSPGIKAVEMTRHIRDAHAAQLEGKTPEERIAFYREKARLLHTKLGRPEELLHDPSSEPDRATRRR